MSSICLPPVVPKLNQDCLELHRAFEGLGCDGQAIIRILAHRTAQQRAQIKEVYKNMFQEQLCKRLKSELHLNFEKAMLLWMQDAPARDAMILKLALKCAASRRNAIFAEILCSRSGQELDLIVDSYLSSFHCSLQDNIHSTFSGSCKELFAMYLQGNQDDTADIKPQHAREDATDLYDAGEGRHALDEATFIRLLTARNRVQLTSIFNAYKDMYGHEIHKGLKPTKHGTTSEFQQVIRKITKCVEEPATYFAKVLYKSMKGLGTDNDTLIRVIVTRAEIDMAYIKIVFVQKFKKALSAMIISDTSGNYRRFLLALISAPY